MTDPTPEELDALVARMVKITGYKYASRDQGLLFCDLGSISLGDVADLCSAITALRARAALVEAAAIERALSQLDHYGCDEDALKPASGWSDDNVRWWTAGGLDHLIAASDAIRALITTGARTLLDQRIAEAEQAGYERGVREAAPQFGNPITLQQAARIMLQSPTVQTMASAWPPLDLVSTLLALSQGDTK